WSRSHRPYGSCRSPPERRGGRMRRNRPRSASRLECSCPCRSSAAPDLRRTISPRAPTRTRLPRANHRDRDSPWSSPLLAQRRRPLLRALGELARRIREDDVHAPVLLTTRGGVVGGDRKVLAATHGLDPIRTHPLRLKGLCNGLGSALRECLVV